MYNWCQKYSIMLQIGTLDCCRYRLSTSDIGLGLSSYPVATKYLYRTLFCKKKSVRKFSNEFSKYVLQRGEFSKYVVQCGRIFSGTSFPNTLN